MAEPLALLHGFGGTHRSWDRVVAQIDPQRYSPVICPDLPGHGARAADSPASFEECVAMVAASLPDEKIVLCGYSFGGRVAQYLALGWPERFTRLVLVSTSAGIADGAHRAERLEADLLLADRIESATPEEFAAHWQSLPIFAGTPRDVRATWVEDLVRTPPADLARTLRVVSTGMMGPVWERLGELEMPVTVIAGQRDSRYAALTAGYRERIPGADVVLIPGAGHGIPREAPEALAAVI